jgi:hypothetical protein
MDEKTGDNIDVVIDDDFERSVMKSAMINAIQAVLATSESSNVNIGLRNVEALPLILLVDGAAVEKSGWSNRTAMSA